MRIYRKIIPKISKDVIRGLLSQQVIDIEEGRRDEAELAIASVLVGYINTLDELNQDTRDTLSRHNLTAASFLQIKQRLAAKRSIGLGEEALDYCIQQIFDGLYNAPSIAEIYGEDHDLRKMIQQSLHKYVGVDEELDREVRSKLRNLREGTVEWEVEYGRLIDQMRAVQNVTA